MNKSEKTYKQLIEKIIISNNNNSNNCPLNERSYEALYKAFVRKTDFSFNKRF